MGERQRGRDSGGVTHEGSKREGIQLALVDFPWRDRTVSWFPTSTSHSEPCCKGTDQPQVAGHAICMGSRQTPSTSYTMKQRGGRQHPCPRKPRQPEVCLSEQKLFETLAAAEAEASWNRNSPARCKAWGTAADAVSGQSAPEGSSIANYRELHMRSADIS